MSFLVEGKEPGPSVFRAIGESLLDSKVLMRATLIWRTTIDEYAQSATSWRSPAGALH